MKPCRWKNYWTIQFVNNQHMDYIKHELKPDFFLYGGYCRSRVNCFNKEFPGNVIVKGREHRKTQSLSGDIYI